MQQRYSSPFYTVSDRKMRTQVSACATLSVESIFQRRWKMRMCMSRKRNRGWNAPASLPWPWAQSGHGNERPSGSSTTRGRQKRACAGRAPIRCGPDGNAKNKTQGAPYSTGPNGKRPQRPPPRWPWQHQKKTTKGIGFLGLGRAAGMPGAFGNTCMSS